MCNADDCSAAGATASSYALCSAVGTTVATKGQCKISKPAGAACNSGGKFLHVVASSVFRDTQFDNSRIV